MKVRRLFDIALLAGCFCVIGSCSPALAAQKPNIVFILADDLGYTDVACYGSRYYETPNIDRLAADGRRFTAGYTCGPNCQPTRAALLSGQYGPRTGVYTVGNIDRFDWQSRPLRPVDNVVDLPLDKRTLPQSLKAAGYKTAMFGKWHLGEGDKHHPGARGFDEAISSQGKHFDFVTHPHVEHASDQYLADFLTDRAIDFMGRHREHPFFLYLAHFAVHSPHEAKPQLIERFKSKQPAAGHHDPTYAAMIASVDESVGRVVQSLEDLKLAHNTLVIFTSDNGGVGGYEREGIQGGSITDNAPLKGGKGMLYEGGIRVPYIFKMPGKVPAGTSCDAPINSVDLYPTLLELAGDTATPDYPLDGTSYARLLFDEHAPNERKALYWHFPGYLGARAGTWRTTPAGAVRSGDWKLIEFFETGRRELYNLKADPGERNNRAAELPEQTEKLAANLANWRASIHAPMPTPNQPRPANADSKVKTRRGRRANSDE
jgi:arylsulfatase A-like enzyme